MASPKKVHQMSVLNTKRVKKKKKLNKDQQIIIVYSYIEIKHSRKLKHAIQRNR